MERALSDRCSLPAAAPEVVSIPDANLAAAVRETIGRSLTTHTMLNLIKLDASNRQITDLTGLEQAHTLRTLNLGGEWVGRERGMSIPMRYRIFRHFWG